MKDDIRQAIKEVSDVADARRTGKAPEHAAPYIGWIDSGTGEPVLPEVEKQIVEAVKTGVYSESSPGVRTYYLPGTITPVHVDVGFYDTKLGEPYGSSVVQLVADGDFSEPIETTTGNPPGLKYVERPPMTLNEIVAAVRTNELVTGRDMRYAIVAFDVLMSQLHIDQHVAQLQEYFKAATAVPREYAGHMNDPENPEAVEWYKAMQGVSES